MRLDRERRDRHGRVVFSFTRQFSVHARHLKDYQELFGRVTLDLGDQEDRKIPTEELLRAYRSGAKESKYLQTLLFQFGRYILISSSRDSLPANLRAIWRYTNWPAWQSDYHTDINVQECYWPAFATNLEETGQPLVKFMDSLVEPGRVTAKEHYGVENGGWIAHTITNAFGHTARDRDSTGGTARRPPRGCAKISGNITSLRRIATS